MASSSWKEPPATIPLDKDMVAQTPGLCKAPGVFIMSNEAENPSTKRGDALSAVQTLLGERPIAYDAPLARALGSATAAIFLSQLIYWTPKTKSSDGWIWKTREEIYEETALTRYEQEGARKVLVKAGVIEEKLRGVPAKMHFRVDLNRVIEVLGRNAAEPGDPNRGKRKTSHQVEEATRATNRLVEVPPTSWGKNPQLDGEITPNQKGEIPPTIAETTTKTTAENNNNVVVEELTERGITRTVAKELTREFSADTIQDQVEDFDWLRENHPKRLGKNPAGFLRKAIEQDYQPPPDYRNPQQRQAEQEQKQRDLEVEQAHRQAEEEQREREREAIQQALSKEHPPQQIDGADLTTESAWEMALERLKTTMTVGNYHTWLSDTRLISCERSRALIVAPSRFTAEHLQLRFNPLVKKELASVVGFFPERIDYLAATDLRSDTSSSKQAAATSPP